MQTALVTGGAGFIGSHLCKRLLSQNHTVVCIDNFITSSKKNIEPLLSNEHFSFIEADVSQDISSQLSSKIDVIYHMASPASPNKKSKNSYINHPIETMLVNSMGTYHLLNIAKKDNAAFLFASTSEIYGDPAVSPQKETYFGNVNPNGVRSVYDEAKRFGEAMTMGFVRTHNINARIIRIFNTYGPQMQKDDGRVVSNFITQALAGEKITIYGKGEQTRSFCYVSDLVEGIIKALQTQNTKGEVINLGNPDERKIAELATIIKDMTNSRSEIVYEELPEDDPKTRKPDITKAKTLLGWEPTVSIEDGLQKTIEYFKKIG
jgi:nucleoside-diphosphate-sugar epimerase